jgi:hypothetical protein
MMKGGTPDPRDFKSPVPDHNTELQVLYWLACQSEFKKDDTLALEISLVNGIWVATGLDEAGSAVRNDTAQVLSYFREMSRLQQDRSYPNLESYPLEAKTCLVSTGGYSTVRGGPHHVRQDRRTSLED